MKRAYIYVIILFLTSVELCADTVELTLYPANISEQAQKYTLLPKDDQQIDADAVPLYEKAIESLPKDFDSEQVSDWCNLPPEKLPQEQANEVLQQCMESLRLVARAVKCKECNWPDWKPGDDPVNFKGYRELDFVIRLWARMEISRRQYDGAVIAMQTGFGMTRHLGQGPTIIQGLVGIAAGELMCEEIEQFIQEKDSPNLYWALANLPKPFIEIEKAIAYESDNLKNYNSLMQKQFETQLKPAHDRVRLNAKKFDNHLNELQVVEAIQNYAAVHEGQLPQTLSDISDVEMPKDLISGRAFEYSRTDAGAILKSAMPEGGDERDIVQYEIVLKK
jgi:hypothetical protein